MSHLNWPEHLERTPEGERERSSKFEVGFRRTRKQLETEMENGVEAPEWYLDHVTGSGGDPGVVLRWTTTDGQERAAACDAYTTKGDNLRSLYLWVKETRMSGQRPVTTGRDQFAAAALPGEVEAEPQKPAHEVLGFATPNQPEAVIKAAFQERVKGAHPDIADDPEPEKVQELKRAKEELIG